MKFFFSCHWKRNRTKTRKNGLWGEKERIWDPWINQSFTNKGDIFRLLFSFYLKCFKIIIILCYVQYMWLYISLYCIVLYSVLFETGSNLGSRNQLIVFALFFTVKFFFRKILWKELCFREEWINYTLFVLQISMRTFQSCMRLKIKTVLDSIRNKIKLIWIQRIVNNC